MDRLSCGFVSGTMLYPSVYGKGDTIPIDQSSSMLFNIDPSTGRPMSDITCLLRSQNALEREKIARGLVELPAEFLPSDLPDEKALEYYTPRSCQLPSEYADFTAQLQESRLAKEEFERQIEDAKIRDKEYDDYLKSLTTAKSEPTAKSE